MNPHPAYADHPLSPSVTLLSYHRVWKVTDRLPGVPNMHYYVTGRSVPSRVHHYTQFGPKLYPLGEVAQDILRRTPEEDKEGDLLVVPFIPFEIRCLYKGAQYHKVFLTPRELRDWSLEGGGVNNDLYLKMKDLRLVSSYGDTPVFGEVMSPGCLTLDSWMRQFEIALFP